MKIILFFLTVIIPSLTIAQITLIPDPNFEQALIDSWLDSAPLNGSVPNANIDTVTVLYITSKNITNLTGIEDFTAITEIHANHNQLSSLDLSQNLSLKALNCLNNQLNSLDITQNSQLISLECGINQLTSLDISQNTGLIYLSFYKNQISSIDVTQHPNLEWLDGANNQLPTLNTNQNPLLKWLYCNDNLLTTLNVTQNTFLDQFICENNNISSIDLTQNTVVTWFACDSNQLTNLNLTQNILLEHFTCSRNQITSLDVSQNTALDEFFCHNNQLTCLNMKNGTNSNLYDFAAINNPNLTCIEVDDVAWSTTNWPYIDPQTSFSTNCPNPCVIGIEENSLSNLSLYPNPTTGNLTITQLEQFVGGNLEIVNLMGQVIFSQQIDTTMLTLNLATQPKGIYLVKVVNENQVIVQKIVYD
ncbi:MAG: T9SS type A sorting domain-containing protein [Flavobacteriales bacterium]|nr:MAG: T9SS type A sorting domain-containing protein [Flavobacteriales bacterium]